MMSQRTVRDLFWFPMFDQLDIAHARGRTQVIHDRVRFIETLRGKNVLVGDAFVLIGRPLPVTVKPDVMFPRDFSQSFVSRADDLRCFASLNMTNYKFPLAACSRSMASNSALKLPLPKLFAPLR